MEALYRETQGTGSIKIRRLFGVLTLLFLVAAGVGILRRQDSTDDGVLLYVALGMVSATVYVTLGFRLETAVRTDGIWIRYPPLHSRYEVFRWQDIEELSFRPCNALQEFGGWGIRYNGQGKGYITGSGTALQIRLHTGRVVVVSTADPAWLEAALQQVQR